MKKKSMLVALVMLSLLQGSVYAANQNIVIESQNDYDKYKNEYNNIVLEGDNNTISISGVNNDDYEIIAGNAVSNNVTITNSELGDIYGAYSDIKSADNNIITIDGSTVDFVYAAKVYQYKDEIDNYTPLNAENNYVFVKNNSTIDREVYGACVWYGDVTNNHVNISDSELIGWIDAGGGAFYAGAKVSCGTADSNNLIITDSAASGDIYGAFVDYGSAINNHVTVTNLKYAEDGNAIQLIGGESHGNFLNDAMDDFSDIPAYVSGNSIDIYGENEIAVIYGGFGENEGDNKLLTVNNNSINIYGLN